MSQSQLPLGYKRKPVPTLGESPEVIKSFVADELQRIENTLALNGQETKVTQDGVTEVKQSVVNLTNTVGQNSAAITQEATTRVSEDSALAQLITNLSATVTQQGTDLTAAEAAITNEQTVRATADTAIASDVTTLTATVNQQGTDIAATQASVTSEATARATADTAIASDVTTLTATVNQQGTDIAATQASVTAEQTARANADSAIASDVTTLTATVNQQGTDIAAAEADIVSEQTARANADSAIASDITNLTATVNTGLATNAAAISSEASARASGDSAVAASVTSLTATVNGVSAAVSTEAAARAAADGVLEAKYGVSLNSNGYITGFSQNNNGTSGTFKILADKFTIIDPAAAGSGLAGTQVFDITNGLVTMEAAHIKNLTVGNVDGTISATSVFAGSASKTFGGTSAGYVTLLEVDCPANSGAKSHTPLINMIFDAAFATDTAYVKLEYATLTNGNPGTYTAIQTLRHKTGAGGNSWTTLPVIGSAPSTTSAVRFKVSIQMYSDNGTSSTNQSRTGTAHWSGTTVGIV
jgi:hypothetical protein